MTTTATIEFKAKVESIYNGETIAYQRIKLPVLTNSHCDMQAFRSHVKYGSYANSDLFRSILARQRKVIFGDTDYLRLDRVPQGVSVDTSGFLAKVSFAL